MTRSQTFSATSPRFQMVPLIETFISTVNVSLTTSHTAMLDKKVGKVLSDEGRLIFEVINYVLICSIIGIFGIVANVINIIIFYKQGFSNTVNIGFLSLAISDVCCLITLEWVSIGLNPLFASSGIPWTPVEVLFLSGAWPHVCFCRITSYITAYITAERYVCTAFPLKVKQIVTPKRTTLTICLIYFLNCLVLIPDYATAYLDWKFVPHKNRTLLSLSFTSSRSMVEGLENVLHSIIGMGSFAAVIIFTFSLVNKLRQSSEWRNKTISRTKQCKSMSTRDQKTMKMIVFISSVLIACYIPGAIICLVTFTVGPEFNILGKYINICMATWSIAFSFQAVNSSINIFFYYNMSSKYKQLFKELFVKSSHEKSA